METSKIPPMERPISFGGWIKYTPRIVISTEKQEQLSTILIHAEYIEGDENGDILCDWRAAGKDGSRKGYTHWSKIALWRDGGDWEDPACLFYRENEGEGMTGEEVHIPPRERQMELNESGNEWKYDLSGKHYRVLEAYLEQIIDDPASWTPFDLLNTLPL